MGRRAIGLIVLVGIAGAGWLGVAGFGDASSPLGENLRELGGGHYAYIGGSNSGFIVTDEGILVVDALISPNHAKRLLKEIRSISDKKILYLVNTHWHWDHTFGNSAFPEETKIYSTEACKARLEKDGPQKWKEASQGKPDDYKDAKLVIPEVTFTEETTLTLGGREILVKYFGKGHTDGDAVIIDKEARVIHAGDLVFNGLHPYMADGHPGDWIQTLEALQASAAPEPDKWKIVPGHGEPGTPALAGDQAEYIKLLMAEVKKGLAANLSPQQIAANLELPEKFANLKAPGFLEMSITRIANQLK